MLLLLLLFQPLWHGRGGVRCGEVKTEEGRCKVGLGCVRWASALIAACKNEIQRKGKGDGERRTLCPDTGVYDKRVVSDVCISGRT